jgi:hypothetical protein
MALQGWLNVLAGKLVYKKSWSSGQLVVYIGRTTKNQRISPCPRLPLPLQLRNVLKMKI